MAKVCQLFWFESFIVEIEVTQRSRFVTLAHGLEVQALAVVIIFFCCVDLN